MSTSVRSIVFVHGTGVRKTGYDISFDAIKRRLDMSLSDCELVPCLWGEEKGCTLGLQGDSIPEYDTARDLFAADEDPSNVLWWMLYQDPLFELSSLGEESAEFDLQAETAVEAGLAILTAPEPPKARAAVEEAGLADVWSSTKADLAKSDELTTALTKIGAMTATVRFALARAVMARAFQVLPKERLLSGKQRDEVVDAVANAWGAQERAFGWAKSALARVALNIGTNKVKRKRGAISDAAYPAAGDILLYQRRGDDIRKFIRDVVAGAPAPVAILAHSLGGIACFDLLCETGAPKVEWLVTAGSQAPFLYEIDALKGLRRGEKLPDTFPRCWLNIYDLRDFLSYIGGKVFPGRCTDIRVDNGQPFPEAHSAYWKNEMVWNAVLPRLKQPCPRIAPTP